jgi:hypothetical protein
MSANCSSAEWAAPEIESGLALEQIRTQGASLFQIRGGKVTRFVAYSDRDWALTSLGLAPQGGAASPAG